MILTVTINPLLEHKLTFTQLSNSRQKRGGRLVYAAGGKGINVSRQLNKLDIDNIALTFAGGNNGKLFRKAINDEGIQFSLVKTISETRICAVVIDSSSKNVDYYFSENPIITNDEVKKFLLKMEKMIQNCEIVIFSGSSPCKETNVIFPMGIEMANIFGKVSFCDTYGNHLQECYSASPTAIHNNVDEIKSSTAFVLNSKKDKLNFLDDLYNKGIKQAFLTDGMNKFYASNFDFHYEISTPNIEAVDSTGSGDSFFAGIAYGWQKSLIFNEQLKLATALGAVNATSLDVSIAEYKDAEKLFDDIEIIPVGKKLKLINDKPT
jgi:1-phosphofructokinase family hexose kinase